MRRGVGGALVRRGGGLRRASVRRGGVGLEGLVEDLCTFDRCLNASDRVP